MEEEVNYFWLNCGYTRWNHNEPLVGQTTLFESGAQFNPTKVLEPSKRLRQGSSYIFIKSKQILDYLVLEKLLVFKQVLKIKLELNLNLMNY